MNEREVFIDLDIDVELGESIDLDLLETNDEINLEVTDVVVIHQGVLPYFEGPYILYPKVSEQMIDTKDKSMSDDVTVKSIPYSEVDNPYGGKTVIIGGEL